MTKPAKRSIDTTEAKPEVKPEGDPKLRLVVAQLMSDLLQSGDFEIEIPDAILAGKTNERIAKLEARIAALEKGAK